MELVAIFLLLIVLVLIVFFVTRPFFERRRLHAQDSSLELSSLLAERESLLAALQELDFDQTLGKIPAEDYSAQRTALLQKGAQVLRQLDTLDTDISKQAVENMPHFDSVPRSTTLLSDDDLEDLLAKRQIARKDKTAGFCPKCGKPVLQSDVFCPSCGSTLKQL